MSGPTEAEPDRTPQPNQILSEPATPQACAEDYANGADVRAQMAKQEARFS
jgi:hypothetical protein